MAFTSEPATEMNMTPLIDVLLVLLVLFVITVPAATHSVPIDLPQKCQNCAAIDDTRNRIVLDAQDRLLWNGAEVSRGEMVTLLRATRTMPVEPELQFAPEARASYDAASRTIAAIKASGVTKFGFVGNEHFRQF